MSVQQLYEEWIKQDLPNHLANDLAAIANIEGEITERFYQSLSFGTGGMRGILGAGTNRMNIYTIRHVAEGLARYIIANGNEAKKRGVALAYDTRHFSFEFACETARVLGAHGIQSYVYKESRPTPQLSFTVRELNAYAGAMITASHNPKQYNGFKVYGEDGAQLTPQFANEIVAHMQDVSDLFAIEVAELTDLEAQGLFTWLADDLDKAYMKQLLTLKSDPSASYDMKLVYTPLHGAGIVPVEEGLRQFGFTEVSIVEEQAVPDGDFPTAPYPNPEEAAAFSKAIELGEKVGANLLLATDPDADRLGVAVWNGSTYELLTGNQLGALLIDYLLATKQAQKTLPDNGIVVKTIVTSEFGEKIASHYNVETENTLTGFKYIAEKIAQYEESSSHTYLFGYEESYGYLIDPFARDKDAVQVALKVAEMAATYAEDGRTLLDRLEELYEQFGYHQEALLSETFEGKDGQEKMIVLLEGVRANVPTEFGDISVIRTEDYLIGRAILADGTEEALTLPKENVIKFILADGTWITVRPSGTEPKCKFYIGVVDSERDVAIEKLKQMKEAVLDRFG
ncbi:phospho-sugar mutase [Ornithinibacillus sp. 4-3]|uniref:phosphoglucomutase (alpha-D-glucose-1,6-bisphosphate-dependent) n=1 Tax=Ornithinibacillus sp. 4-3 TaxID=3231488 RepID=A0AB39HP63_9BACI